ncbi:uncharacterized protein LOC114351070 [Ostrinia furnacalis]|uniref:uncharacterized protein LOC114351070 n=1 Tax=Ostrinia furnacalis TaxID=93504 RepID=UPI0010406A50|nr:uncharacterized protein LOC114351070 [Ostrinia furnacalis]
MPKRSAEELIKHYEKKIAKIRRKEITPSVCETDDDSFLSVPEENSLPQADNTVEIPYEETFEILPEPNLEVQTTSEPTQELTSLVENVTSETTTPPDLDPELLAALGDPTDDTPEYGSDIHERLAKLWQPLLKKGLDKESKDRIYKEYTTPNNCRLLQAPKMNPEIMAAVTDARKTKDKRWATNQQQIGSAITAINRAMEKLMTSDDKASAIKHLSNSCRMLCDMHALFTKIRTRVVCTGLDKTTLSVINNTERDELLFGANLSEKIRWQKPSKDKATK